MSRSRNRTERGTAIVARRDDAGPVETEEIRSLATAGGYDVVREVTQLGPEDPGTHFGRGKVDELAGLAGRTDATTVLVGGELSPSQHHDLQSAMPPETRVMDRYRLVLEIFEADAGSRRAQLQVELAGLRYDLPRIVESADEGILNGRTEKGSPVYDVRDRIDALERKLAALPDPAEQFRERRREEGFDLATIAGYTNAGKSTLLHRLADDLDLEDAATGDRAESPPASRVAEPAECPDGSNKDSTAAVADRLFETLETTTRRATIDGRPVLATDTVGFVDDLPHDLVRSFSSTLSEAAAADVVVLVVDASEPRDRFREKLETSLSVLAEQDVDRERVLVACNKADLLETGALERRLEVARERVPTALAISALEGDGLAALREAIAKQLPTERRSFLLPNCDAAMSIVSRAYDRTTVESVDYDGDTARLECRGRPDVLERLTASVEEVTG